MTTPTFLDPPQPGLPFAAGVVCDRLLFLSGQIGVDVDGRLGDTLERQVDLAMRNLGDALAQAGAELRHIVKCTVMLKDMARWAEFNSYYLRHFPPDRLPARSAFGGVDLAFGAAFEIDCTAVLPDKI